MIYGLFAFFLSQIASLQAADVPTASTRSTLPESPTWEKTLDRVVPSVVAIRVTVTRQFDTDAAGSYVGTGFVVDAERGLLLTNRHMVHPGPVVAEGVFLNHEEVPLEPIYRDPIHDFGVYRFDPSLVKYMKVEALRLAPEKARVGMDIRVVGNDAGEKISILDGTLARLDRNAPVYGNNTFNDFNTFYFQAASNTSGGSSGSPVVDISGDVVALNAGGSTKSASSFYLPLDRVVPALQHLQKGEKVPRGTLQTVFEFRPFDELKRLGLSPSSEKELRKRFPNATGALVVDEVVPEGIGMTGLTPGDILLKVENEWVNGFVDLAAATDRKVGQKVALEVERGGQSQTLALTVGDLHHITPYSYLEYSGAILHNLSFQQARNHGLPVRGVYVATPGYSLFEAGIPDGAVITSIDGIEVTGVEEFKQQLEQKRDRQRVRIRWFATQQARQSQLSVATVDRRWFGMRSCSREDVHGTWPCQDSPPPPPTEEPPPQTTLTLVSQDSVSKKVAPSLVMVDFDIPFLTDGMKETRFQGTGVIVDAQQGLVVTDRDTVPIALGDITLTFGGEIRVPARLVYLHPQHNLAILRYDPDQIGDTAVQSIQWSSREVKPGDSVWQVAMDRRELVSVRTKVKQKEELILSVGETPKFRETNVEGITLEQSRSSVGGLIVDRSGRALALWASFRDPRSNDASMFGLPSAVLLRVLEPLLQGNEPQYRTFGADFARISLADARDRGLPSEEARKLLDANPEARKALIITRLWGGSPAAEALRVGDILLAVNGTTITRIGALEDYSREEEVMLTVAREGNVLSVKVGMLPLDGQGTSRIFHWAGAVLQESPLEISSQQGLARRGVYVSSMWYGSPAQRYGLRPSRRIVEVEGTPVANLDQFAEAVSQKRDRDPIKLKLLALDGKPEVVTMKLDLRYWPTVGLEMKEGHWERREGLPDRPSAVN